MRALWVLTDPTRAATTEGRSGAEGGSEAGAGVAHPGGSAGVCCRPRKVFVAGSACPEIMINFTKDKFNIKMQF